MTKPTCIIVDLDGTLCNNEHRQHHLETPPPDWEGFYAACTDDRPYPYLLKFLQLIRNDVLIVLCTGRPELIRDPTMDWLTRNEAPWSKMLMRPKGNTDPDHVVKEMLLKTEILPIYEPLLAIDDRPSVIAMWKANHIPVFEVDGEPWSLHPREPITMAAYHLHLASGGTMDMVMARAAVDAALNKRFERARTPT